MQWSTHTHVCEHTHTPHTHRVKRNITDIKAGGDIGRWSSVGVWGTENNEGEKGQIFIHGIVKE